MTKLNKRKVRWIVKHFREGMSVYQISKIQDITYRIPQTQSMVLWCAY